MSQVTSAGPLRGFESVIGRWNGPEGGGDAEGPWWVVRLVWAAAVLRGTAFNQCEVRCRNVVGVPVGDGLIYSFAAGEAEKLLLRDGPGFVLAVAAEAREEALGTLWATHGLPQGEMPGHDRQATPNSP